MKNSEIKQLFKEILNIEIDKITDISKGLDQKVKIIESQKIKYILKIPKEKIINFREFFALKKLKNIIKVPKVIYYNDNFLIEEYIEGKDLDEIKLSTKEKIRIYSKLGKILKNFHSIKMTGFGLITNKGKAEFKTLKEFIEAKLNKPFKNLKNIDNNLFEKTKLYIDKNKNYLNKKKSVLLHFDFADYNIKIKNKKFNGLIDFGDLSAGPKLFDLVKIYIENYNNEISAKFIKSYGKIDINELNFYTVIILIELISFHKKYKNTKELKKNVNILKNIVRSRSF